MSAYAWMDSALCAQTDPDLWHPEGAGDRYRHAKTICGNCPVRRECEAHADRLEGGSGADLRWGLWAARTVRDRKAAGGQAEAVAA
jgi:hypothetical protein